MEKKKKGISTGFIAGSIDIVIDWMSSLKQGTCSHGFWLNQRLCCWESGFHFHFIFPLFFLDSN